MNPTFLDILAIAFGVVILLGLIIKPSFWWNGERMRFTRERFGERNTIILYIVTAVVLIAVGVWGSMQGAP